MSFNARWCSSLYKVLPNQVPSGVAITSGRALRNEVYSFQLAYFMPANHLQRNWMLNESPWPAGRPWQTFKPYLGTRLDVSSDLGSALSVRQVKVVPVETPSTEFDDDYVTREAAMLPDLLTPLLDGNIVDMARGQWRSLWFSVKVPKDCPAGHHEIHARLTGIVNEKEGFCEISQELSFDLEILPAVLPNQTLIYTNWFHADCLATYYGVETLSEEHWRIIGNFMKNATEHGVNMILTPVFTLPLDTKIGGERPTFQLVDVTLSRGKYTFGFTKLARWIRLARRSGFKYIEISHLFTQWGAAYAPKVIARVHGKLQRIFGWDTAADSPEYVQFLEAFLPALASFITSLGIQKRTYFHCSDEPNEAHLDSYQRAMALLKKHLGGFRIIDALSDVSLYKRGAVDNPVPIIAKFDDFVKAGFPNPWVYYCCWPMTVFPNRFIAMNSARNRILGMLLYRYNIQGFLHWGFNFYYSRQAEWSINPYYQNDGTHAWPGGDPFIVYPGQGGRPEASLREVVFAEGLQDQRLLQLLERKIPRADLEKLLDNASPDASMTMSTYPHGEQALLALREALNDLARRYFS